MKTKTILFYLLLPAILCTGCFPLGYKGSHYDGSYSGLRERWDETTNGGTLRMIMVHGMAGFGAITPGYGDGFANGVANRLGLSGERDNVTNHLVSSTGVTNFLRTFNFTNQSGDKLAVYELTWSPMTICIKGVQFTNDIQMDKNRLWGNIQIKGLVDSGFGDALLYLNPAFRAVLQAPILQALTNVEHDATNENDRIVFVTHSLGSKMTLDTMLDNTNNPAVTNLASKTTDIIMLANQLPLLDLGIDENVGSLCGGQSSTKSLSRFLDFVGEQRHKHWRKELEKRPVSESINSPVVRVVAATDPNDDLSYPLKASSGPINGTAVSISDIYKYNAWGILFLLEWPPSAHTGYFDNNSLIKKLVDGFPKKGGKN